MEVTAQNSAGLNHISFLYNLFKHLQGALGKVFWKGEAKLVRLAIVVCLEKTVELWGMGQKSSRSSVGPLPPMAHCETVRTGA